MSQKCKAKKQTNTRKTSVTFSAAFDKLLVYFVAQAYAQHVVIPVLSKVSVDWTVLVLQRTPLSPIKPSKASACLFSDIICHLV